jgi:hypothetical protein
VDQSRKRVLLIAASILAARKLAQMDSRPSPAREAAMAETIQNAERTMQRIDAKWARGSRALDLVITKWVRNRREFP